jgi:hypothetical protein
VKTSNSLPGSITLNASTDASITAPASTSVQGTVSITVPVNEPTAASDTRVGAGTASLGYHDGGIVTGVYVVGEAPGRRWVERWHGSGPDRGWWVWETEHGNPVAYIGEGDHAERLTSILVEKHNAALAGATSL